MKKIHCSLPISIILAILMSHEVSVSANFQDGSQTHDKSYMLPDTIFPEAYRVDIITNLADYDRNFTFEGKVWILIKVVEPTNTIVLHAKNLEIFERDVTVLRSPNIPGSRKKKSSEVKLCENECKEWIPIDVLNHNYNEEYELYMITLAEQMDPREQYIIYIPYQAELTQSLAGYYRSSYKELETGETRWLAVTQFESTDARRALPCFDEPAFKAVFQVNLGHVAHRTSISNMELEYTEPIKGMPNWVWDHYVTSVRMSTYLLAFVICDFSHKVAPPLKNNVLFRVWARKDAINQVDFALEVGPKVLLYFEKYFDVKYPLSKLDMIAIPDFSSGAMENWGLITYREVALLYDPQVSTASSLPYVASVVAHEIAHQWFGNLVTMKWWTDLWLNEGFATYVAALGVQYLHPKWNYYEEEVVDNLISVLSLDSLKSSHPISVPIGHPREIAQIFDTISYKKGSYVLRMMNLFLGEETFTKGITRYLQKHAYCNAEQDDLWMSLTEEAHANKVLPESMTVKEIMDSWTLQTGYPLITIYRNYESCTVTISQERFLSDRNTDDNGDEEPKSYTFWWVPLRYTWESVGNFNETKPQLWLSPKDSSISVTGFPCNDWILFNIQVGGLYRVKYDDQNWEKLTSALNEEPANIALLNRVQLIDDSLELAKTGDLSYETAINLIRYLVNENEYLPWKTALRNLGFIDRMMRFTTGYGYFRNFMINLLYEIYYELSSQKNENVSDDLTKIKFQSLISAWACKYELGDCRENAVSSFEQWMQKSYPDLENPIPKDHRSHVYCTAIKFGGEKEWNFLWQRYMHSNVGNEKSLILSSLSCTREIWLLNRYLDWSLNEKSGIRKQDSVSVFAGVARGNVGFYLAMNFLQNRIYDIYKYFGPKTTKLGNYFSVLANQITTVNERDEMVRLVNTHEKILRPSMQAIKQALENAKINIEWQKKFYKTVTQLFLNEAINKIKVQVNN